MEELFKDLDITMQKRVCTIPQYVSAAKNPDEETEEQIIERQDKCLNLPLGVKNKLSSSETGEKIYAIGTGFNLKLLQMASIARTVRNFYFKEIKLEDFPNIFAKEIEINSEKAKEISEMVIRKIINDDSIQKQYESQIEKLSIKDALKKYEGIGEQLVTTSHIKLKNFPDPVRPSIKNWISDYTFNAGHDSHNSMDRGVYLFQNENTKRLSSFDRQKIAFILKAYDENNLVEINATLKQVIFPKMEFHKTPPAPPVNPPQNIPPSPKNVERGPISPRPGEGLLKTLQKTNLAGQNSYKPQASNKPLGANLSFSSPHKLPFEKQSGGAGPEPMRITPGDSKERKTTIRLQKT